MLDVSEVFLNWSQIVFNVGASFAGIWAVYQYFSSQRVGAVKWTQQLFEDFYVNNHFEHGRDLLEYEYSSQVVPLLRMRVVDRDLQLDEKSREQLSELDKLLNYFEHLIYLEKSGVIKEKDRKVFFDYWFFSYC